MQPVGTDPSNRGTWGMTACRCLSPGAVAKGATRVTMRLNLATPLSARQGSFGTRIDWVLLRPFITQDLRDGDQRWIWCSIGIIPYG